MFTDYIWTFVKKVLPWTLLLMFMSFGIAYMIGGGRIIINNETGQIADSYLYCYYRNGDPYYIYDIAKYIKGLQMEDIFDQWTHIGDNFKMTWTNMTEHFDWQNKMFQSLGNAIIMIPNMLMNIINTIVILPLQLAFQILTCVMRILGFQVNQYSQFWLGKVIYNINQWTGIPQIPYIPV